MQYQGFLTEPTTLTLFVINIMGGGGSGVMAASMTALAASGVHNKGGLVVRKKLLIICIMGEHTRIHLRSA